MKVLRVITSLKMGGAERSIVTNVPMHIKNGIEMDVFLLDGTKTDFYNELLEHNVKIITSLKKRSLYNPLLIWDLMKILNNYDIIHAHLFPTLYWVAFAKIFSKSKVSLIYTEHSTHNKRREIKLLKYLEKFIYKQYETIISISEATTNNLREYLGYHKNIVTINNGVDLTPFNVPSKLNRTYYNLKPTDFVLIQIASFRGAKDQETVIKALNELPNNVHLFLVGVGELLERNKLLVDSLNLNDRVHFLGKRNDIADLIKISDVLIMSSKYEGFGRAAVEGMAAGLPVIATDVPGLRDVVNNYGLLFHYKDFVSLSKHVINLMNDKQLYNEISSKCLNRANYFDVIKMIDGYENEYQKLIK